MMATSTRPALPALKTPASATLPSELPRSPYPGTPLLVKAEDGFKTPITPPTAYMDFLKAVSSPMTDGLKSGKSTPTSAPSSESSACSCQCEGQKGKGSPSSPAQPQSAPTSATLRRLMIPPSPLRSPGGTDSPISAFSIRSPFTVRSPFEWDFEGGKRWSPDGARSGAARPVSVRQVVTRTVTYKPRMDLAPPPKGKKRRLE